MSEELKVLELFGGIGALTKALERQNIAHKVVDYVEIDKYAVKSFNAIHGTDFEPQDITKWDKDIECDLIMHGSPCQDFSVAGLGKGGDKASGTRSSLMYETLRIVEKLKPKYVIWENVKNLLSKKHRHNFDAYLEAMEKLGYENYYQVLNAKHYGVPQNRERVFTVSILDGGKYLFPEPVPLDKNLKDVLEKGVDKKYYLDDAKIRKIINSNFMQEKKRIQKREYCDTILARDWKDPKCVRVVGDNKKPINKIPSIIQKQGDRGTNNYSVNSETSYTIPANPMSDRGQQVVGSNHRIRKLTPKECWRLMGFDDSDFEKAEKVNSNTQLYKQAGNSIVVNVLEAIVVKLLEERNG